jgi:peptide/nickel transport system permease protein
LAQEEEKMLKYIIRRFLLLIPVIIGVAAIIFFIMSLMPEDPVRIILADSDPDPIMEETLRKELGLDKPVIIQFVDYMKGLVRGDLGLSYKTRLPVFNEYMKRIPNTLYLSFGAMAVALIVALPIGIISAVKQYSWFDNLGMTFIFLGLSVPNFWLGLLLLLLFSVKLGWLPGGGIDNLGIILPAITLGTGSVALYARMTRASMLEVIRQDYIRTARAKGLKEKTVVLKHALKNSLIPIITVVASQFGHAMGGAMVTETIFAWPGIGRFMIEAVNKRDRPVVIGCVVMLCIMISIIQLFVDILYGYVDPRIRTEITKD